MEECQLKREHCEKILADELNKDINGVPLNQLKVDEQVSKVKIYKFFYEDQINAYIFSVHVFVPSFNSF